MEAANPRRDAQQGASPALWWDGLEHVTIEPPLETDTTADIAIVGGVYNMDTGKVDYFKGLYIFGVLENKILKDFQ